MSLLIRQRILSLTDTYDVTDHLGNLRYQISTEFLTLGHKIHVFDNRGHEVGRIDERVFRFLAAALITINGVPLGEIHREFSFFVPKYSIDFNGWEVEGDILGWDYEIRTIHGETVASVSRELFHLSDAYSLTVLDPQDELAALMTVIAIDMFNCRR